MNDSPMRRVAASEAAADPVLFVPGSTAREDFRRCVRAVKAKRQAFTRGPLFLYSPRGEGSERLAHVRELEAELSRFTVPREAAYLMRTSGSASGTGKIVLLSTSALVASARATDRALGGPGRWVTALPTAHIAGFQTVFRSLLAGKDPLWAGSGTGDQLVAAVSTLGEGERAYLSLVPTQLARLLDSSGEVIDALRRFDAILLGGAAIAPTLLGAGAEAGLRLVATYGMTETCGGCVYDGLPLPGVDLSLGEDGRISLSGDCISLGYAGGDAFHGTFTTSDVGRLDADGRLDVLGRLDGAVTSGGVTVIPQLVERELLGAGCEQAVVVGIESEEWGEEVVALVSHTVPHLRQLLAQRLEKGWVPRRILSWEEAGLASLPLLPSGKVDRAAVAAHLEALTREGADAQEGQARP